MISLSTPPLSMTGPRDPAATCCAPHRATPRWRARLVRADEQLEIVLRQELHNPVGPKPASAMPCVTATARGQRTETRACSEHAAQTQKATRGAGARAKAREESRTHKQTSGHARTRTHARGGAIRHWPGTGCERSRAGGPVPH